jgi:hypothetical protein
MPDLNALCDSVRLRCVPRILASVYRLVVAPGLSAPEDKQANEYAQ